MSRTRWRGLSEENGSWNTGWISRARSRRSIAARLRPSTSTSPALGGSRPRITRASVDLPQPDSPTMPSTSPAGSANDTPSTARTTRSGASMPARVAEHAPHVADLDRVGHAASARVQSDGRRQR